MEINLSLAVAVIKKEDLSSAQVHDNAAEPSVQIAKELKVLFFEKVDQETGIFRVESVAVTQKAGRDIFIYKTLSSQKQHQIRFLVVDRHAVGERALYSHMS